MSQSDPAQFREQLIEYIRERKAEGKTYVKPSHVANEFDEAPQRAGTHLHTLEERGYLEEWAPESNRSVWRILPFEE